MFTNEVIEWDEIQAIMAHGQGVDERETAGAEEADAARPAEALASEPPPEES